MAKEKIQVYDIQRLSKEKFPQHTLLVERFGPYLERQAKILHTAHRHSFFHIVLFSKGRGTHTIDFTNFKVNPYQIYFMIPGQVHSWQFTGDVDGYIVNFSDSIFRSFLLDSNYLEQFRFFSGVAEEGVMQLPVKMREKIIGLFEEMLAQTTEDREKAIAMTRVLLMQLFMLMGETGAAKPKNAAGQHKQQLLKNFRQLIESNYRKLKLPKEYADRLFVTPNYLNVLCQELLNKTAGELIRDRVLLEAKRMLIQPVDISVSEIAAGLHFEDKSYFSRFFKKHVGLSPEEFRKQL